MTKSSESIIQLNKDKFYGKGTHKKCFIHPQEANLCIKIPYNEGGKIDLLREIKYLDILKNRNKDYSILPKYYGEVTTSLGTGYVFELIKDYNDDTSITLEDVLKNHDLFAKMYSTVETLLKSLKCALFDNEIITMGIFPENIIFQKTSSQEYRVRIVNDMGSSVLIPLEYYFTYFARKKILRRWVKFLEVLKTNYNSPLTDKLIDEIK